MTQTFKTTSFRQKKYQDNHSFKSMAIFFKPKGTCQIQDKKAVKKEEKRKVFDTGQCLSLDGRCEEMLNCFSPRKNGENRVKLLAGKNVTDSLI
jgi:hypothetical protein